MERFNLDLFKMGYVIQYAAGDNDKFSKGIINHQLDKGFKWKDARFTHVEISGGGQYSVNIAPPRSACIDITKAHAGRHIRIIRPKCYDTDLEDRKRLKVAYKSATQSNLGYDMMGILKFKIPFLFHKAKEYFCSEGCCEAIQFQFPDYLEGELPYNIVPAHFSLPQFNDIIWEGEIPKCEI